MQNEVFVLLENNGRMPEPVIEEAPAEESSDPPATDDEIPPVENKIEPDKGIQNPIE